MKLSMKLVVVLLLIFFIFQVTRSHNQEFTFVQMPGGIRNALDDKKYQNNPFGAMAQNVKNVFSVKGVQNMARMADHNAREVGAFAGTQGLKGLGRSWLGMDGGTKIWV